VDNKYRRLYAKDRKVIASMKQAGKTQNEMAQIVGIVLALIRWLPFPVIASRNIGRIVSNKGSLRATW